MENKNVLGPEHEDKPTIINHLKGYVALPFEGENLKDFISGLLGSPQTITKEIQGIFDINLSDLQDLDHLLNQRVTQQNNGHLLQLKIQIFFDDESTVSLNSLSELISYNEVKAIVSKGVRMNWSYLIQFPDKTSPEKQEIEIIFVAPDYESDDMLLYPFFSTKKGVFSIRIEHTARTWGTDIEYILSNKIESFKIKQKSSQLYIQKNANVISLTIASFISLISMYFVLRKTLAWNREKTMETEKFLKSTTSVDKKLDYVVGLVSENRLFEANSAVGLYYIFFFIIFIVISIQLRAVLKKVKPSFLTLTKESVGYKELLLDKYKNKTAKFWWSIILGIIINIISTVFFEKLLR